MQEVYSLPDRNMVRSCVVIPKIESFDIILLIGERYNKNMHNNPNYL